VFLAIGWTTLASLIARLTPWSESVRCWLVVCFAAGLGVLDFVCLVRYVAPAFR
jgi:hypothetical protein